MQKYIKEFKKSIIEGNVATVEAFLKKYQLHDAANWILDDHNRSALHYLASSAVDYNTLERENLVRLLLQYGADVNLKDKSGVTPIYEACVGSFTSLIQIFIERDADVKVVTHTGNTLLQAPVLHGENKIVDMLLEAGANAVIDIVNKEGDAVIHSALNDTGDNAILHSLIEAGASINIPDKKGQTILHINTLLYKNEYANSMLLAHGADYLKEDHEGMTALQYAAKESFYPLINGFINAKLSEYSAASTEEKDAVLDDYVEKFKMILLENPGLSKPAVLLRPVAHLQNEINALSTRWDNIQQELQVRRNAAPLSAGVSSIFKLSTVENLSLSNTSEEGNDKAFKPT